FDLDRSRSSALLVPSAAAHMLPYPRSRSEARRPEQPHAADEAKTSGTRSRPGRRRPLTSNAIPGAAPPPPPRIHEPEGRDAVGTAATYFVGIDVSKATLDVCLLGPDGRAWEAGFANDVHGYAALIAWAERHAAGAALH